MNNLYFACTDCQTYIDAGYRWAYWELEDTGMVIRGYPVDVELILSLESYWNPEKTETSRWLYEEVFPPLREFFRDHQTHRIIFGEEEDFADFETLDLEWLNVGFLPKENPRSFVELLGLRSWDEVYAHVQQMEHPPYWWEESGSKTRHFRNLQEKFEELRGRVPAKRKRKK